MNKQLNIRYFRIIAFTLVFVLIALVLTVRNAFGRYGTKVSNVIHCVAASDDKLYVTGLESVGTDGDDPEAGGVLEILRNELAVSSVWEKKGGEQYITFTVANGNELQVSEQEIFFRIRVLIQIDENNSSDENADSAVEYSSLNFTLDSESNKYYSRIDNINPKTALSLTNNINGWMFNFCKTINDEVIYTLNGKNYDEITFTLSVSNTEVDCSDILIYIDRVN